MIGATTKTTMNAKAVTDAKERAAFRNFGHAAARISKDAKASIRKSQNASDPGEPPKTRARGGKNLRSAIRYAANKEGAVIGPMASMVGTSGEPHEFGGEYRGQTFDKRPFMRPALEQNLDRFGGDWAGSIGE